jgi:hypothetical protein
MADLDGGFFDLEKGVDSTKHLAFMNSTLQRIGDIDLSIAMYAEPPADTLAQGEDAVGAWLSFLCGGMAADAMKSGGVVRFEIKMGPAAD